MGATLVPSVPEPDQACIHPGVDRGVDSEAVSGVCGAGEAESSRLSTGELSTDEHDEIGYRTYVGGACIGAYYLLRELAPIPWPRITTSCSPRAL
jgi:hypothetical protein